MVRFLIVAGVVVIVFCGGLGTAGWLVWKKYFDTPPSGADQAKTGDCLALEGGPLNAADSDDPDAVRVVDCAAPDAGYTVLGRFDDVGITSAKSAECAPLFTKKNVKYAEVTIYSGGNRDLLCLEPRK